MTIHVMVRIKSNATLPLFALFSLASLASGQLECHEEYECKLLSLSSASMDDIECYGYNACISALKIESTFNGSIHCWGSYSCYTAVSIQHTSTSPSSAADIECYGLFSCSKVLTNISQSKGDILCHGEQSCADSKLVSNDLDQGIYCWAFRSCAHSDLTVSNILEVFGSLAAQDATLRAQVSSSTNFSFDGNGAAEGAQLVCEGECNVLCYSGGCVNLNITCNSSSSCQVFVTCESATQSVTCPEGYVLPSDLELPSLATVDLSNFDNSHQSCFSPTTKALNCDNYQDASCYDNTVVTADESAPVCCTASHSCQLASNIIAALGSRAASDGTIYETAFRADGYYAADLISDSISAPNGGHMYFTGMRANYASNDSFVTTISGADEGKYDIMVTGTSAMRYKSAEDVRNIYCMAVYACEYSSFSNIKGNIYGYTRYALRYTSISSVLGDVYCDGSQACYNFNVMNVQGNVVGVGVDIMLGANISNVGGTVLAYGSRALYGANVQQLTALYVSGEQTLDGAEISSGGPADNFFVANINGTSSAGYNIYCNEGDKCKIKCLNPDACFYMHLHCIGTCLLQCDSRDAVPPEIKCPLISGPWKKSSETTVFPTKQPSLDPSESPSTIPTMPSSEPSIAPSRSPVDPIIVLPTGAPTNEIIITDEPKTTSNQNEVETAESKDSAQSGMTAGGVAGLVVGILVALVCIGGLLFLYLRERRKNQQTSEAAHAVVVNHKSGSELVSSLSPNAQSSEKLKAPAENKVSAEKKPIAAADQLDNVDKVPAVSGLERNQSGQSVSSVEVNYLHTSDGQRVGEDPNNAQAHGAASAAGGEISRAGTQDFNDIDQLEANVSETDSQGANEDEQNASGSNDDGDVDDFYVSGDMKTKQDEKNVNVAESPGQVKE